MLRNMWRVSQCLFLAISGLLLLSCGGTSVAPFSGSSALPQVTISLTPQTAAVQTNAVQAFTATVGNTSEAGVAWLINGLVGGLQTDGSYPYGQIDKNGNYTAPPYVPTPNTITITAAAMANNTVSANATVSISGAYAPGTTTLSPKTANVSPGGVQLFTATVNSDVKDVIWSVNNVPGGEPLTIGGIYQLPGSIDQAIYVAPVPFTGQNPVTITATSVAYPTQFASSLVTVAPIGGVLVTITQPTQLPTVPLYQTQHFAAKVTGTPNTAVSWYVDGIAGGNGTMGTIAAGPDGTATYTAPTQLPNPTQVIVSAVSDVQPSASASMIVTLITPPPVTVTVGVNDTCANLNAVPIDTTLQFISTVSGSSNSNVIWQINGVNGGGNSTDGTITSDGLYTAPTSVPGKPQVNVTAVSQANPADSGSLPIIVTANPVLSVKISPPSTTVTAGQSGQQFTATVTGAADTFQAEINWLVNGQLDGGGAYGTIIGGSAEGCVSTASYVPPATVPNPASFPVTAQSNYDPTKSQSATVTVIAPPVYQVLISPGVMDPKLPPYPIPQNTQQIFNATVTEGGGPAADPNVYWSLSGPTCTGAACGTLSTDGPSTSTTYTAPNQAGIDVTLTAVAQADPTKTQFNDYLTITCGGQPTISIFPTTAATDAGNFSPLSFSATITPCGNQSANVSWQMGCISLWDGDSGENCEDTDFDGDGPGCIEINGLRSCSTQPIEGPGTESLSYYAPRKLFINAFEPNVCEETNNNSGEGQVPVTATVTVGGVKVTSPPACITVCAPGSPTCP